MQKNRDVLRQVGGLAVALLVCIAVMLAVYVRPLVLALIYVVLFRAKVCDPVAALLPLLFAQVAIKVLEFFRNDKKGGDTAP